MTIEPTPRTARTRRDVLLNSVQLAALAALWPGLAPPLLRPRERGERALVVVELEGGNDGLNTVVPLEDPRYFRARPTLSAVADRAHAIGDRTGLHPALGRLAERVREGRAAVVRGVGHPHPDRSHFRSMDIWHTGRVPSSEHETVAIDRRTATGWLGRLGTRLDDSPLVGVHVGPAPVPLALALAGRQGASLDGELLERPRARPAAVDRVREAQTRSGAGASPALALARRTSALSLELEGRLEAAAGFEPRAAWPATGLARQLATVAALLASGFPARVYTVRLTGFDTHVDQARRHAGLLAELDGALGAFADELAARSLARDVATLVFSEFGRRVAENGARGTDHGAAGPVLLDGPGVVGGLHGPAPDLARLVDGDVPHAIDLRALQAAVERDWFGLAPEGGAPLDGLFG